jgi:hypothetical protein
MIITLDSLLKIIIIIIITSIINIILNYVWKKTNKIVLDKEVDYLFENNTRFDFAQNHGCKYIPKTGINIKKSFCTEGGPGYLNETPGNCGVNGVFGLHVSYKCETSSEDWCSECNNYPIKEKLLYKGKMRKVLCGWKDYGWDRGFYWNVLLDVPEECNVKWSNIEKKDCKYIY